MLKVRFIVGTLTVVLSVLGILFAVLLLLVSPISYEPERVRMVACYFSAFSFFLGLFGLALKDSARAAKFSIVFALSGILLTAGIFGVHLKATRPHQSSDFQFTEILPATQDISGTWTGTWEHPDLKVTEEIEVTVTQNGNDLSGSIAVFGNKKFDIVSGTLSGNEIHIIYALSFPKWDRSGATLRGTVNSDSVTGTWYAHGRSWDGPFELTRKPGDEL